MKNIYQTSLKISIIIPVFNRENLIEFTINSIRNQSYENFECLLIDDGSTDKTLEVMWKCVKNDNRFKILKREEKYPKGPSGCRNMGLDIAQGEYIQFFDSDDLMHPDHLKLKVEAIENNNIDLVVCKLGEFYDIPENVFSTSDIDDQDDLVKHISGEINYYLPGPLWKKEIIGDTRFKTETRIYEDLLFNITNRNKCKKLKLLDEVLIFYRRHDESTTGKANRNIDILNEKRKSWRMIYSEMSLHKREIVQKTKHVLFKKSCLNFYYILCKKSILLSIKQCKDMIFYASTKEEYFISLKLIILSPVVFFTKKGYRIFHLNRRKEI